MSTAAEKQKERSKLSFDALEVEEEPEESFWSVLPLLQSILSRPRRESTIFRSRVGDLTHVDFDSYEPSRSG